ncbi:MAG TPA: hypothetical protein VFX92_03455 [Candidatus Krumholzibacteria bacterium]|nr:hypothetical protein [Candidatus Krumholzibacteria bacterium]
MDTATPRTVTVDIEVPLTPVRFHRVTMTCVRTTVDGSRTVCESVQQSPIQSVRHKARVAATLGRALVTTVGAVVGTLVDAAVEASAALV